MDVEKFKTLRVGDSIKLADRHNFAPPLEYIAGQPKNQSWNAAIEQLNLCYLCKGAVGTIIKFFDIKDETVAVAEFPTSLVTIVNNKEINHFIEIVLFPKEVEEI